MWKLKMSKDVYYQEFLKDLAKVRSSSVYSLSIFFYLKRPKLYNFPNDNTISVMLWNKNDLIKTLEQNSD